ncbi:molybdenum ABC transporter permease [Mucilaginibacter ginsenosidivorax]|uniref:Molybdenum ABC transporter permease n=1 Tax=Mucilaginibacter ginsenosidivorax TaxID=862126 RepID=A0A5B8W3F0_9SPHI|nr:molybdenum ABC transporter permease [Mucilaginibacter ginsenosidivorax]QEC78590.1 molybdenum ABC transporter permease [Mucilaginibacter ginsenosidivorax]
MTTHHNNIIPIGLLLLALGFTIRYQIGRRRFNRRGIGGLQQFSTYSKFIFIMTIERVIYFIATLCLWAGLFLLAFAGIQSIKF